MKKIYRFFISIAAAFGTTGLIISGLSIIRMLRLLSEYSANNMRNSYMESYYHYQYLRPYLLASTLILLLLFYVFEIQKKNSHQKNIVA